MQLKQEKFLTFHLNNLSTVLMVPMKMKDVMVGIWTKH